MSVGRWIATAAATGWLITGSVTQETPVREARPASRPADAVPDVSFKYSDELRERLNRHVTPDRGRNPFLYGSRHAAAPAMRRDEAVEIPPVPMPPPEPPAPVIRLSGIASDQQDGVVVLTAIVSDNGRLVFAKVGDTLPSGFTVQKIDEFSMTLVDAAGVTQTIRLP